MSSRRQEPLPASSPLQLPADIDHTRQHVFTPSISSSIELESNTFTRETDNTHLQGPGPTPNIRRVALPSDTEPLPPLPGQMNAPPPSSFALPAVKSPAPSSYTQTGAPASAAETAGLGLEDVNGSRQDILKQLRRNTEDESRFKEVAMQLGLLDGSGEPDLSLNPLPNFMTSRGVDDDLGHLDDGAPARASGDTQTFAGTTNREERWSAEAMTPRESVMKVDLEKGDVGRADMRDSMMSGRMRDSVRSGGGGGGMRDSTTSYHMGMGMGERKSSAETGAGGGRKESNDGIASYLTFRRIAAEPLESEDEDKGDLDEIPIPANDDREKTLVGPRGQTPLSPFQRRSSALGEGDRVALSSSDGHQLVKKVPTGAKPGVPVSSYYTGPPSMDAAFGTDPEGNIGVHHPREIIRIERDYSGGEIVQFSSTYLLELEGRISPTEFQETINGINERLISAYSVKRSIIDNGLAILTLYLSMLVLDTHYDKQMARLENYFDEVNTQLWNPRGLNLNWPRKTAFLFLEIEYY